MLFIPRKWMEPPPSPLPSPSPPLRVKNLQIWTRKRGFEEHVRVNSFCFQWTSLASRDSSENHSTQRKGHQTFILPLPKVSHPSSNLSWEKGT